MKELHIKKPNNKHLRIIIIGRDTVLSTISPA